MTKRVTVSLPDDLAEYLDNEPNASAAVADALRARRDRAAATAAMLRAMGIDVTDAGIAGVRGRLPRLTDEQRAENARRRDLLRSGHWPADDSVAA